MERKLSNKAMDEIRRSLSTGKALARRYGVSEALVSRIRTGGLYSATADISVQRVVRVPAGLWIGQGLRQEWHP